MIPLNHSCRGPLGADCSGVRHDQTTVAATEMTLRRTRSEDRASSSSGRQAGLADRSALANRTCKSDLHRTSSYDSRRPAHPALSLSLSFSCATFPFPPIRGAYFRRAAFSRWDPRLDCGKFAAHTYAHMSARMRDTSEMQLPRSSAIVLLGLCRHRWRNTP